MRNKPRSSTASTLGPLILAAATAAAGCGYHFAASGSTLPTSASTIYVRPFDNRARATGVQDQFARSLKDEIARHKRLALVDSPGTADLELDGTIRTVDEVPTAFNAVIEPLVYNSIITVDAKLVDSRTRRTIWSIRNLSEQQQYASVAQAVVPGSQQFLQQNLRAQDIAKMTDQEVAASELGSARDQSLDRLARDLYAAMAEGF